MVWFGSLQTTQLLNHIILLAKKHIHYNNIKSTIPNLKNFKNYLKQIIATEKFIFKRNDDFENFKAKWSPLLPFFN